MLSLRIMTAATRVAASILTVLLCSAGPSARAQTSPSAAPSPAQPQTNAAAATTSARAQTGPCASVPLPSGPPFDYTAVGLGFLQTLQADFFDPSTNRFYNTLACDSGTHGPVAFMWTEDTSIAALRKGAMLDPGDYTPVLANAIAGTEAYAKTFTDSYGTWTAYSVLPSSKQTFFDDNALFGDVTMNAYLDVLPSAAVLTASQNAISFVYGHRQINAGNGTPEEYHNPLPTDEIGAFDVPPALAVATVETLYGHSIGNSTDINIGLAYFNEVTSPALGLLKSDGLYAGYTQYHPTTKTWKASNKGDSTTSVIRTALDLYQAGQGVDRLAFAESLMQKLVDKYYTPDHGVNQISVWGGSGMVEMLCALYLVDHRPEWYADAKNSVDFLLAHGRDKAGFFANGFKSQGRWNVVRTGQKPDATVTLITQESAAAAILDFAYVNALQANGN